MERRRLERRWLKTGLEVDKQIYQQQCVHVVEVINGAKGQYYRDALASSNPGQSWRVVRSLLFAPEQTLPETDSDGSLAERFSAYFRNKISGVRASLDLIHTLPTQPEEIYTGRMLREFVPIIETSLRKIILRSPPKSCDDDPVPTWLLREGPVLDAILSALTAAVNESLRSGTVEPCLKSALVRPL